jgi:hypothetical protein
MKEKNTLKEISFTKIEIIELLRILKKHNIELV